MHIVRVFGDDGIWAYSSELIETLDDCIHNGARVVNMSLGGDRPSVLENMAFRKAEKAAPGVSVLSTVPVGSEMLVTLDDVNVFPMDGFDIPAAPFTAALKDCGLGESATDCGDATEQICLIERGGFSFAQKALSCEAAGGIGTVVYN